MILYLTWIVCTRDGSSLTLSSMATRICLYSLFSSVMALGREMATVQPHKTPTQNTTRRKDRAALAMITHSDRQVTMLFDTVC